MGNEVDPVEYARVIERLTGAITNIKESFGNFQEIQRDFSDTVLGRFMAYEKESALNDRAREQLDDLLKDFNEHRKEFGELRSSFKAWLTIGIGLATAVGGALGNYFSNHIK